MPETITVEGMSCAGCEEAVEEALLSVTGVTAASADRDSETATADGNGDVDVDELVEAVEDAGYEASA